MGSTMKLHQFARAGRFFDHHEPSLSLGCSKRLRPLAPKSATTISAAPFDLKSFIRPESGPRKLGSNPEKRDLPPQVETHPGGTRWNPTQEQIAILEMLYRGGMRTPNAQQIEQITGKLGKYGKIEGKNVFYWFQNHKARERQKQKRNNLGLNRSTRSPATPSTVAATTTTATSSITSSLTLESKGEMFVRGGEEDSPFKRKCTSWSFESLEDDRRSCRNEGDGTLQLFPLHPEKR